MGAVQRRFELKPNRGHFGTEGDALRAIVERLAEAVRPESIWLFGSRARGNNRPDSDYDILVVTRNSDGEAGRDYERVLAPLKGLGIGCDVIPIPLDDFVAELDHPGSMFADIARHGMKIYGGRTGQFFPPARR